MGTTLVGQCEVSRVKDYRIINVYMRVVPVLFKNKENCCGCSACYSVCPKNAIKMCLDEEGFLYPKINKSICVGCQKCITVCLFKKDQKEKGF